MFSLILWVCGFVLGLMGYPIDPTPLTTDTSSFEVLVNKHLHASDTSHNGEAVLCECGVFNTKTPSDTDIPLIAQRPFHVSCDNQGLDDCIKLCSALTQAAKDKGPSILCAHLGHYNNLQPSVHSRICDTKQWTYTNLTALTPFCCHDKEVVECKDEVPNPEVLPEASHEEEE